MSDTLTVYECPEAGCPAFFGCDLDTQDGRGDYGPNPDGWPRCEVHDRPMQPVAMTRKDAAGVRAALPGDLAQFIDTLLGEANSHEYNQEAVEGYLEVRVPLVAELAATLTKRGNA